MVDGWCKLQVLPSPMLVDKQLGFWRRLTTQTCQILRFQVGSGGLAIWGKLFPLGSIRDKVWQSWEVFMRRRWGGSRSDWLALSCFAMWWDVGSLQLVTAQTFSPAKYSSNLHFFDVSVSTLMIFLRIPYIICPAAANVLPLTGWPPSIPQISISDCKTTLCRERIFHAFVEQKQLELNLWYLLSLNLCCPRCRALLSRQMKLKSKIVKISDLRIPWYVSSHVQAWGSMLNDMWHWALKDACIKCVKYAFALLGAASAWQSFVDIC